MTPNPLKQIMRSYSVVMSTYNKDPILRQVLHSINRQDLTGHDGEIIIVDDGSTDNTINVCAMKTSLPLRYVRLDDAVGIDRNPSVARNVGYRMAVGDVIIAQSDDVVHQTVDAVVRLVNDLEDGNFVIATVYNYHDGARRMLYTGEANRRPYFFLGSLTRRDLFAVGGNDEDFKSAGYDDNWFADCLMRGRGLSPVYHPGIVANHIHHDRSDQAPAEASVAVYEAKVARGIFVSSGGPWEWRDK